MLHDIALVGLGPTGAVLANLLGRQGLRVLALERDTKIYPKPRAVFFDDEIMGHLTRLGLGEAVQRFSSAVKGMDLVSHDGTLLYQYRPSEVQGPLGFAEGFMFMQPELEEVLRAELTMIASVDIRLGYEVTDVCTEPDPEDPDGPPLHRLRGRHMDGAERSFLARFVVGCDGAHSMVRRRLGSTLEALGEDARWLVADLTLKSDAGARAALPEVTVQYCDPERPATFVPLPHDRCRFELRIMPQDEPANWDLTTEVKRLLAPWIDPAAYEVDRVVVYTFHALLADAWHNDGLLIAGDAAHQMPPFLGQGMCSGLRDAVDLGWKLGLVASGQARRSLLDTYSAERKPHVAQTIAIDLRLGELIQTIDPEMARLRDTRIQEQGGAERLTPPRFPVGPALGADDSVAGLPIPHQDQLSGELLTGTGFRLIGDLVPTESTRRTLGALHSPTDSFPPPPALREWLEAQDARAVVVRPDAIVLGLARSPEEVDQVLAPLADLLAVSLPSGEP